jgi:hypothetical protein
MEDDKQRRIDKAKHIVIIVINISNAFFSNNILNYLVLTTVFRYMTYFQIEKMLHRYLLTAQLHDTCHIYYLSVELILALMQPYTFLLG